MKNKESFWEIKGAFPLQKQLVIRHKIEGVINPLFCAECLPLFIRAADHGCFIWVSGKGSNITAVFLSQTSLKSSLNKKDEELMKQIKINKKGFTLIEILIVVLIIGILAAIAVPKYQEAVDKSRMIEALTALTTLQKAIDIYVLENGYNEISFLGNSSVGKDILNIELNCTPANNKYCNGKKFHYYEASCSNTSCMIGAYRAKGGIHGKDTEYWLRMYKSASKNIWTKSCYSRVIQFPYSQKLCLNLEKQGWEYHEY